MPAQESASRSDLQRVVYPSPGLGNLLQFGRCIKAMFRHHLNMAFLFLGNILIQLLSSH